MLLIPGIQIVLSANLIKYFEIIKKVADYDVLGYINIWNLPYMNKFNVDSNAPIMIVSQMQNIGYDNRNAVIGLGTFTFLIIIYFIRLILAFILKIISLKFENRFYIKVIYNYV